MWFGDMVAIGFVCECAAVGITTAVYAMIADRADERKVLLRKAYSDGFEAACAARDRVGAYPKPLLSCSILRSDNNNYSIGSKP